VVIVVRTVITPSTIMNPVQFLYIFRTIPNVHILSICRSETSCSLILTLITINFSMLRGFLIFSFPRLLHACLQFSGFLSFVLSRNKCHVLFSVVLVPLPLPLSANGQPPASPSHRRRSTLEQPATLQASPTGPRHRHA